MLSIFSNISSYPTNGLSSSLDNSIKGSFNIVLAPHDSPSHVIDLGYLDDVVIKPNESVAEIVSQNRGAVSDTFITDLNFEITCSMFEWSYDFLKTTLEGCLVFNFKNSGSQQTFVKNIASLKKDTFYPLPYQNTKLTKPVIQYLKKDKNSTPTDITDYSFIQASGIWGIVLQTDESDIEIQFASDQINTKEIFFTSSGKRPKLTLLAYQKEKGPNGTEIAKGFRFFNVSLQTMPTITAKAVQDKDNVVRFPLTFKATTSLNPISYTDNSGNNINLESVVCQYIQESI